MMVPLSWMMSLLFSPLGDRVWVGPGIGAVPRTQHTAGLAAEEVAALPAPAPQPSPPPPAPSQLPAPRSSGSRPALPRPALPALTSERRQRPRVTWPARRHSNALTHHLARQPACTPLGRGATTPAAPGGRALAGLHLALKPGSSSNCFLSDPRSRRSCAHKGAMEAGRGGGGAL